MGGSESKSDREPGESESFDVSDFIRREVEKMIANSVVAKGKDWAIDMKRNEVKLFIEQKIQLLSPSKPVGGLVKTVSIVYNGTKHAVHIPISHNSTETQHTADNPSTTYKAKGGGKGKASGKDGVKAEDGDEADAEVGILAEASAGASTELKGSVEHKHTHLYVWKKNEEDEQGELDVVPTAHQNSSVESQEFMIELKIRAHKKTKVTVRRLSEANYGAKAGASVGAAAGVAVGALGAVGGAALGAAAGTVVPIIGNIIGGIAGGIAGALAGAAASTAAGAGAGAGIGAAVTELDYVTLTAEDIFQTNKEIAKYRVEGDYVYLTLKHIYTAPAKKATVNPY